MAENPMGAHRAPSADPRNVAYLVNRAGTIVSTALVIGACVWGYQILSRDVSGVPVVRALEGPMRIQPENPGGQQAGHQGLMVNRVAAVGGAAGPADQVIVAPPPISLSESDAIVPRKSEEERAAVARKTTAPLAQPLAQAEPGILAQAPIVAPKPLTSGSPRSVEELAAQLAAGAQPLTSAEVAATQPVNAALIQPTTEATSLAAAPETPVIQGGIKRSLRPVLRPVGLASTAEGTQVASAGAIDVAPKTVDAANIPAGTRLVQLGAFASPEIANAEWDKLQRKFDTYLSGKSQVIQKASSGGRVFYRLRAMGFDTVSDARRLCSALKAENADCIPVTTR